MVVWENIMGGVTATIWAGTNIEVYREKGIKSDSQWDIYLVKSLFLINHLLPTLKSIELLDHSNW